MSPSLRFPEFTGEWENKRIGDIGKFFSGGTPSSSRKDFYGGEIPFIRSGEIHSDKTELFLTQEGYKNSSAKMVEVGDILLALYGANSGDISISQMRGAINQAILCIRTNVAPVFFKSVWEKHAQKILNTYLQGGQGNLSADIVKKITISIPSQIEQAKIAALFSHLDERISIQNRLIDRLQSLIKGINRTIFTGSGLEYSLCDVCEIRSGYSGNQLQGGKGLGVSRIETISAHNINLERIGYVAPFDASENYRLQVGDILFSNINSVEYIGNTAFIDKDYNLYHGMNLLRLIPFRNVVVPFYLYILLNTNRMLKHFKTICNKAVSQASINQKELGKTIVMLPSLEKQQQVCNIYQAMYSKLKTEKDVLSFYQEQKRYLLRHMFI